MHLNVTCVSGNRPDKWDDNTPYPLADYRGKTVNNFGSGYVLEVSPGLSTYDEDGCPCYECKNAESKADDFWQMAVHTTRHMVFDEMEAEKCVVTLGDCLQNGIDDATKLIGGKIFQADTKSNNIILLFFSHDDVLGERLESFCNERFKIGRQLRQKFSDFQNILGPVFLISYQHGAVKVVTVGELKDKKGESVLHTAASFPGSSGGLLLTFGE